MAALNAAQIANINAAIDAVQNYVNTLQAALAAAANAGDSGAATTVEARYDDAQLLESQLKGMLTISDAASLQASVQAINNATSVLDQQKTQIDAAVSAVGIAATALGDIAAIVAAVVKL
ncbi:MAG TPA: hypothetical protein VGG27_13290 [Magnetospirillaceae bacterium]|jgi:hypothetical protein